MNSKIYFALYFLFFSTSLVNSQSSKLAFIQNKGQWDSTISYKTDFPGGQALATNEGMLVGLFDSASLAQRVEWGNKIEERSTGGQYYIDHPAPPALKGHGWRYHFLNGNSNVAINNKYQSSDFYNFWVGDPSQHASKVRSFEEITYKNVYDSIDVRYYTSAQGYLENDIIVNPTGNAGNIEFEIEGIDSITLNVNGDLTLATTVGDVTIPAPVSYLLSPGGPMPIQVDYILQHSASGYTIKFFVPAYDSTWTLVIDPVIVRWATWATNNSSVDTHNHGSGIDSLGNLYVTGRVNSTGLITVGAFQSTVGGLTDIYVGKYTEPASPGGTGTRVWQTYLGGSGQDNSIGLQMGTGGYIYLSCNTSSDIAKTYGSGFTAGSWTQRTGGGASRQQALIVKLDLAGNGALTREIGSTATSYAFQASDIRILETGNNNYDLIFSGYLTEPANSGSADGDFPQAQTPSGSSYTQPATAKLNALILRISRDFSNISWIKNLGSDVSTAVDEIITITTIDEVGDIYAAGYTKASANISYNNPSTQASRTGNQDGWIMKINDGGVVQWSRYFNSAGAATSSILSMEMNKADTNITIAGTTTGLATSNITSGCIQTTYGGSTDLFVAKISKFGNVTNWGTYCGGSGTETNMMGLNVDDNDDIYFIGYSSSTNYPTSSNPLQAINYGSNDAVFTKLNSTGTSILYSTYYGGSNDDNDPIGQRGILFNNCRAYLSITAASNNVPLTSGTLTSSKTSATTVPEPVIVAMANPPDLINNMINSCQTISCGGTPSTLTGASASYNIPDIIRNNTTQTAGTTGAYPAGVPSPSGYQWQMSTDYTYSWSNISGATSQNYTPGSIYQTTYFRRIVSGDYCSLTDSNVVISVSGGPTVNPTATCAASTLSLFANPFGGGGSNTYSWIGPLSFTSTSQNPQITSATNAINGAYTVTVTDVNGCKDSKVINIDFNSCTYSVVLSVSLLKFNAVKEGQTSLLTWQTANERNSDNFEIERSIDGKTWGTIGTIAAAGLSTNIRDYRFTDKLPYEGVNYYRLKVYDIGGNYKYSSIKVVNFDKLNTIDIVNAMPNPFTDQLNINYNSSSGGDVSIRIIDAVGRILNSFESHAVKGMNNIKLDTGNFSNGIYFIAIDLDGTSSNYKMMMKQ